MMMLDHSVASIRNKALEAVKLNITSYLESKSDQNGYGETLLDWVLSNIITLIVSNNPTTRYNALDILQQYFKKYDKVSKI